MGKFKRARELIPPWNMPSDPVKAVIWFMGWLLKIAVRFFWVPIIVMVALETYLNWSTAGPMNGVVGGIITLLIGLFVWAVLYILERVWKFFTSVSRIISEVGQLQRSTTSYKPFSRFEDAKSRGKVVEGTIITDLEQERKKRRRE
ncbi:hypothetical protein EPA93_41445 [Ktedonosporobacter rubrisoli]|uniref:DUF4282 domain-containing protein n=1 Tax=Ktedonosporobacter rubrisoli TaxID=2509675 RepID=A0A4P6K2L2_KTERU|nr:hypothetical protein [Ktedonosporobacter rubrisoli]QBD82103.1 hypothetical protein EPA93_41445 [Ktedonosporobacter rubrisoli]